MTVLIISEPQVRLPTAVAPRRITLNSPATFNLLRDPWIPVRRRSGTVERIRPHQITDRIDDDPYVAFDWPRADFNGASHEFLIGLLATALSPANASEWGRWWHKPPTPVELRDGMTWVEKAFELDGPGPRFMQEIDLLSDGKIKGANILLVETPGRQTLDQNKDFFVKRSEAVTLSLPAAAMALFTLQTYAPGGGRGHLTSLRGGGPMTTLLVVPHDRLGETLWGRVWPNVPDGARDPASNLEQIFPWLTPTRTSEKGRPLLSPDDTSPLQVYWWMPRRIRLSITQGPARCALAGEVVGSSVSAYRTKQYGMKSAEGAFEHPLSAHAAQKKGDPKRAIRAAPSRIGYPSWPGLVVSSDNGLRTPAQCVRRWGARSRATRGACRFAAFGLETDKAKVIDWIESEQPLWAGFGGEGHEEMEYLIGRLATGAFLAQKETVRRVKEALFAKPSETKEDFADFKEDLIRQTQAPFEMTISRAAAIVAVPSEEEDRTADLRRNWADTLSRTALALFDQRAPVLGSDGGEIERRVRARYELSGYLRGRTKFGETQFFEQGLDISVPDQSTRNVSESEA